MPVQNYFLSADHFTLVKGRPTIAKAPGSLRDYFVDFDDVLGEGVTIVGAEVVGQGVTVEGPAEIVNQARSIKAWISGGAFGSSASATFTATLSDGRTIDPRTIWFEIQAVG